MKLSRLFSEGWEELGIEDPNIDSDTEPMYAQIGYHHSIDLNEVENLVKNMFRKKGFHVGEFAIVPGTIGANEDEVGANGFFAVDINIDKRIRGLLNRSSSGIVQFEELFPNWQAPSRQDRDPVAMVTVEFELELN